LYLCYAYLPVHCSPGDCLVAAVESVIVIMPIYLVLAALFRSAHRRPHERQLIKDLDVVPHIEAPLDQHVAAPVGERLLDSTSLKSLSVDAINISNDTERTIDLFTQLDAEYNLDITVNQSSAEHHTPNTTQDKAPVGNLSSNAGASSSSTRVKSHSGVKGASTG